MPRRCREFVDSRLRRSPPDRASAVPCGQAGENATRFPHLAHRSAAAHKLHSTPQQDRMNLISGKGKTSSRLPAFSLFLPGSCPNARDRRKSARVDPFRSELRPGYAQDTTPHREVSRPSPFPHRWAIFWSQPISEHPSQLSNHSIRPAELAQFTQRIRQRWFEGKGSKITGLSLLNLALQFQDVIQLQVGVRVPRLINYCCSIGAFRFAECYRTP
jgi:hypothetical protein